MLKKSLFSSAHPLAPQRTLPALLGELFDYLVSFHW